MIVFHYDPATFPKGTMVGKTPIGPAAASPRQMLITMPAPFPSPPLALLNIISCFLATVAFVSAFAHTLVQGSYTYTPGTMTILPSSIGLLATVPFHFFLYRFALEYARTASRGLLEDTPFLPIWVFVYMFFIVTLWVVILIIDILCNTGITSAGMIISAVLAGCEALVFALLTIKCVWESWDAEDTSKNPGNLELPLATETEDAVISDDVTLNSLLSSPRPIPKYLYFASYVLATLAFISSISPRLNLFATIPIYFLTVMVHVPLFVSSGSARRAATQFPFEGAASAGVSSLLVVLWCIFVLANLLIRIPPFQKVLSGIFGVMECIIVAHIAIKRILESLSPPESQIQLQED